MCVCVFAVGFFYGHRRGNDLCFNFDDHDLYIMPDLSLSNRFWNFSFQHEAQTHTHMHNTLFILYSIAPPSDLFVMTRISDAKCSLVCKCTWWSKERSADGMVT